MTPGRRGSGDLGSDGGSISLLTLGLLAVVLVAFGAVVDASAVFLARRDLAGQCDSAALSAAQAVDPAQLYAGGVGDVGAALPVSSGSGTAAAEDVARADGEGAVTGVRVHGGTVDVTCRRRVRLPLGGAVGLDAVTVTAAATADSPVR